MTSPAEPSRLFTDLNDLIPRNDVKTCKICTLLKVLPANEGAILDEAIRFVAVHKIRAALAANGHHDIGERQFYNHRQYCQSPDVADE